MHCAIYEPDNAATPITIPQELWQTYEEDRELTRGIKTRKIENPGEPLFYLTDSSGNLVFFGPTMMFRLPYKNTVWSMIPDELRQPLMVDFADAMFGFVRDKRDFKDSQSLPDQGEKARAYASRIHMSDAELAGAYTPDKLWLMQREIAALPPHILSTPKPTSFQHYLIQEEAGKPELSHYDSPTKDAEGRMKGHRTFIRGAKRYWPQGDKSMEDLWAQTSQDDLQISTQHTLIKPVCSGVSFTFRVYFENLSDEELGALCWALHPLGDEGKDYCHQLGMGKPLGMGAVNLDATLHLSKRKDRYETLFDSDGWATGYAVDGMILSERGAEVKSFTDAFEGRIRKDLNVEHACSQMAELKRIAMLLKMMEWENGLPSEDIQTQDLQEGFKQRRVLPDPSHWIPPAKRAGLVEPEPTQNSNGGGGSLTGVGGAKPSGSSKATPSRMGNLLSLPTEPPPAINSNAQSGKERVTLVGQIKNGAAQVKTEKGEQIKCEKMPAYNAPKPGAVLWARVERDQNGKATGARYIPE
jgi:CRISPR-associated protein (TIGR03986 family)